jgi:hypothetical protein
MRLIDRLAARFVAPEPLTPIERLVEDTTTSLPSGFLKRIIDLRDSTPELARIGQPGMVHLSELVSLCARQHCLMLQLGMATTSPVTGAHRVMWKIGRAVEAHVRQQLVDGMPMDAFGRWRCICSRTEFLGHRPAEQRCSHCGQRVTNYHEMTLVDETNGVVGNPDIVLRHGGRYVSTEIKSRERGAWEEMREPLANHVMQAAGYRRLLQTSGFPVHDDVVLIYVSKDFAWGSPYKEFHVRITRRHEEQLDSLFAEAKLVRDYLATGTLPPRVICTHPSGRKAKGCTVNAQCFAR